MKCPKCGYTDETAVKVPNNVMHEYVFAEGPSKGQVFACMNNDAETIQVKDGPKLIRKDKFKPVVVAPQVSQTKPPTPEPTKT